MNLKKKRVIGIILLCFLSTVSGNSYKQEKELKTVFSWKQIGYEFDGVQYLKSSNAPNSTEEPFFEQYNNVPIGLEIFGHRAFITVPRRRVGIPSTLNYVWLYASADRSPLLMPYPDPERSQALVSVYRPRVDACGRLWAVDTGLIEVPGARRQLQRPAIVVFDLKTDIQILRYELKHSDLVNERTPGGLTSITVDVTAGDCGCAFAYITDLATSGLVVYSLALNDSWRVEHDSFHPLASALNFSVAGFTIPWQDGLFSIALSEPSRGGDRKAFYHPLVSTKEYSIDTRVLKNNLSLTDGFVKLIGDRGSRSQSGSHGYHAGTRTLLFANVAQDAISCWRVDSDMEPDNVATIVQDHKTLVYISDLKIVGDSVWVLVNQIPRFAFSELDRNQYNYFVHRGRVQDLIRGTVCANC